MKTSTMTAAQLPLVSTWSYADFAGSERILMPSSEFVVTRDFSGNPLSRFGEVSWKFLSGERVTRIQQINFISWAGGMEGDEAAKLKMMKEMQWLFCLFLWFRPMGQLSSSSLSNKSTMLRSLAQYAFSNGITMVAVLSSERYFRAYISKTANSNIVEFAALVTLVGSLGTKKTGINLVAATHIKALEKLSSTVSKKFKQDPPLPPRLFSNWIRGLLEELTLFEEVLEDILARHIHAGGSATGAPFLDNPKLIEYFDARGFQRSWPGFVSALTFGQTICHSTIQTFSGMRTLEASSVPFKCLERTGRKWGEVILIHGITTKGNGGGRETSEKWVTSEEGARAIAVAQRIAAYIYTAIGIEDNASDNERPFLFVSTGYLDGTGATPNSEHGVARTNISVGNDNGVRLQARISLQIDTADVVELSRIAPHRAWSLEPDFQVGKCWKVRSRQLRRSLAMYASASGLVTLPSLKWQLKHLTRSMVSYYTKGAKALRKFAMDNAQHFAFEYQNAQVESQLLSYELNVVESGERLAGGHGQWINVGLAKGGGVLSKETRRQTESDFKKGKMAYKETPLGGCTTITACEKHMLRIFTGCPGCARGVVIPSRVDRTILIMEEFASTLPLNSVEHRSQLRELAEMKKIRANL